MAWTECVSINKILSLPDSTECNILHVTNSKKKLKVIRFVKVSILGRNFFVCKCKLPKFTCHNTYVYFSCLICKYPLRFFFFWFFFSILLLRTCETTEVFCIFKFKLASFGLLLGHQYIRWLHAMSFSPHH